jgi:hypothetical protein
VGKASSGCSIRAVDRDQFLGHQPVARQH